jgi:predicted dehydrogenase
MKVFNVGLVGAGFMAKAHSIAYSAMPMFFWPNGAKFNKKIIVDIDEKLAKEASERYDFKEYSTNWEDIISDPAIDIVDICTPNNSHYEIAIAAAKAGKHIVCEKPLALNAEQAKHMYEVSKENNIYTMVAYNYRNTPAVQLAKKYIAEGSIGEILDFHSTYLQDWSADENSPLSWRFQKKYCGTGTLGDIGTHVIDMMRFLVGDFVSVNSKLSTYIKNRPIQTSLVDSLGNAKQCENQVKGKVDVDDFFNMMVKCKNGAFGTIEATRNAWGRNNYITFEIHGTKGSIYFDYEKRDQLQVCFSSDKDDRRGFRTVYTGPNHPYGDSLWPIPALGIGYTEVKCIEMYDFIKGVLDDKQSEPNFKDGYQIELICDAIIKSAKDSKWVDIESVE